MAIPIWACQQVMTISVLLKISNKAGMEWGSDTFENLVQAVEETPNIKYGSS